MAIYAREMETKKGPVIHNSIIDPNLIIKKKQKRWNEQNEEKKKIIIKVEPNSLITLHI